MEDSSKARIIIDPNVRVRGSMTYTGFEDTNEQVATGDTVLAIEQESEMVWDAVVTEIDDESRLIYLYVNWKGGHA